MCETKGDEMKKLWHVKVSFLDLDKKPSVCVVTDPDLQNILDALEMVPGIKILSVVGERRPA